MPSEALQALHRAALATAPPGALHCVETHCGGQPARIVVHGVPALPGASVFEKMLHMERHADALRKRLLFEPRGSPAMMADVIVPPSQ